MFQIYDGPVSTAPVYYIQPKFVNGQWTRPVVASTGRFFFLNFTAAETGHQKYVGFRARFWSVPSKYNNILYFNCQFALLVGALGTVRDFIMERLDTTKFIFKIVQQTIQHHSVFVKVMLKSFTMG